IAEDLELNLKDVSIKAKTKEGVDAVGEGRAVEAHAVVLIQKSRDTSLGIPGEDSVWV
ncbi:MAG: hypothetical protein HN368_03250, partial [Spirochaetales bacterium]|nr:hypothetical protein [Spirochaetales bacterium]